MIVLMAEIQKSQVKYLVLIDLFAIILLVPFSCDPQISPFKWLIPQIILTVFMAAPPLILMGLAKMQKTLIAISSLVSMLIGYYLFLKVGISQFGYLKTCEITHS